MEVYKSMAVQNAKHTCGVGMLSDRKFHCVRFSGIALVGAAWTFF